jgi:hypothetical protein
MNMKSITVAYLLALFLYPLGLHRQYMGRADWWLFPVIFGGGIVSMLSGFHTTTAALMAVLSIAWIWDLATMWRWER